MRLIDIIRNLFIRNDEPESQEIVEHDIVMQIQLRGGIIEVTEDDT